MSALVAGIGNPFFGDDGFGVEVLKRLRMEPDLPGSPRLLDAGVGAMHLVFEILSGPELLLVADCTPRGGAPGTLYLIEPDATACADEANGDGNDLSALFALLESLKIPLPRTVIIACEPFALTQPLELSPPVAEAVQRAVDLIRQLLSAEGKGRGPGNSD
jgi:hydrogenase maturation protease